MVLKSVQVQSKGGIEFLICTGRDVIPCENISSPQFKVKDMLEKIRSSGAVTLQDIPRGLIYNQGIRRAQGEYIYLSDSDIVFPKGYFEKLIHTSEALDTPLKRPMMRRLLLQDFERFYDLYSSEGFEKAMDKLDYSQEFVVKTDTFPRDIRVFRKWENGRLKTFIISEKDFEEYTSNLKNKGSEPKFFNQERHCGATFARKSDIENLGGCCEGFISWGCWDADLQWKLEETYGISYMPREVIHLDHPKGYFNRDTWQTDRNFQEIRRTKGALKCIQDDREVYSSK